MSNMIVGSSNNGLSFNLADLRSAILAAKDLVGDSPNKLVRQVGDQLDFPRGEERALAYYRASQALNHLWGDAYAAKRAAELANKKDEAKALSKEMEVFEKASSVLAEEHDRLLGADNFWSRRGARRRTAELLEKRGLASFHAREMGVHVAAPIVAALDRQAAVGRLQTEVLLEQLKLLKQQAAAAAPAFDLLGALAVPAAPAPKAASVPAAPAPKAASVPAAAPASVPAKP